MVETSAAKLPYTLESTLQMLSWGAAPDTSPYTHRQIAEWCDCFWFTFMDVDASHEIQRLLPVLLDVQTHWRLFIDGTYTLEQLQSLNQDQVKLPSEWFLQWLRQASGA